MGENKKGNPIAPRFSAQNKEIPPPQKKKNLTKPLIKGGNLIKRLNLEAAVESDL